VKEKWAGIA